MMSLVVEELLPFNCLNVNHFRAIHMHAHSDAHEYVLEQELLPNLIILAGDMNLLSNLNVKHTFICLKRRLIGI